MIHLGQQQFVIAISNVDICLYSSPFIVAPAGRHAEYQTLSKKAQLSEGWEFIRQTHFVQNQTAHRSSIATMHLKQEDLLAFWPRNETAVSAFGLLP